MYIKCIEIMPKEVNMYHNHHHHYGYYYLLFFALLRQESKCLTPHTGPPVTEDYTLCPQHFKH